MENRKEKVLNIVSIFLFSIGIGSFLTYYILGILNRKIIQISDIVKEAVSTGNAAQMETGAFIYVVFIIGVLAFSIAPVMRTRTIHSTIKMIVFLGLFFLTASGLMLSSARGGMDITYMIVVWFFCIFSTYLAGQIIMKLYFWMKKNESNEIDMVKMTFVWTILAYVLGKLV